MLWFDVGTFRQPWQDSEELIVIIEATKDGSGYYAVVDCGISIVDPLWK